MKYKEYCGLLKKFEDIQLPCEFVKNKRQRAALGTVVTIWPNAFSNEMIYKNKAGWLITYSQAMFEWIITPEEYERKMLIEKIKIL